MSSRTTPSTEAKASRTGCSASQSPTTLSVMVPNTSATVLAVSAEPVRSVKNVRTASKMSPPSPSVSSASPNATRTLSSQSHAGCSASTSPCHAGARKFETSDASATMTGRTAETADVIVLNTKVTIGWMTSDSWLPRIASWACHDIVSVAAWASESPPPSSDAVKAW
jgi:hypothetical protein